MHYCDMVFDLLLLDGDDGYIGKHNMLKMISHTSVTSPALPPNQRHPGIETLPPNIAHYPIPVFANFRFHRYWHFRDQYQFNASIK